MKTSPAKWRSRKIILAANTSWYLKNFRAPLIMELISHGAEVVLLAPRDQWSDWFATIGARYIDVPMNRKGVNPLADLGLLRKFHEIYRKERPDSVFQMTIKPVIYGSVAARLAGVHHVLNMVPGLGYVFVGDQLIHRALRPMVVLMYRIALRNSGRVFFQNPEDREYFLHKKLVRDNQSVVTYGSGVDLDHFTFVEPTGSAEHCTFLLMARMLWDKGVGEFVDAAKSLKPAFPNARFLLLGMVDTGNRSHVPRETLEAWTREGSVEYLGEVGDVRPVVELADVVVLPSYYREGVPKSLLEALAMGKPIITTDTPGCRETVVDGVNGLLIPPRDRKALLEAIRSLITQPGTRAQMGRESRSLAVQRFDVRRVNAMIMESMGIQHV